MPKDNGRIYMLHFYSILLDTLPLSLVIEFYIFFQKRFILFTLSVV